jgi:Helix-turn-helix domain
MKPHNPRCSRSIRSRGLAEGWGDQRIAEAIGAHCGVSLLRAHRLARGWTLMETIAELRASFQAAWGNEPAISHQRLSQWEMGADIPTPRYLDALCRLYASRPDRLGFGNDYGIGPEPEPGGSEVRGVPQSLVSRVPPPALAVGRGGGLPSEQLLATIRGARVDADVLLETQTVSPVTVDHWEALAEDYGQRQLVVPLDEFLADAVDDFSRLCGILGRRQPLDLQQRLYRVMAQLAGLIGFDLMGSGALKDSHGWYHTARLAAEETGDRQLKAWLMACESMTYFWDANLTSRAAALCLEAEAMAGSGPTQAGGFAASVAARAYAKIGQRTDAINAMNRAERTFEKMDSAPSAPTRLGFYEARLRYDQESTLTRLGELKAAMDTQAHALRLCEATSIEATMVKLDHASCLMLQNEVEEGYSAAQRALVSVSPGRRYGVILFRAQEIADMRQSAADDSGNPIRSW